MLVAARPSQDQAGTSRDQRTKLSCFLCVSRLMSHQDTGGPAAGGTGRPGRMLGAMWALRHAMLRVVSHSISALTVVMLFQKKISADASSWAELTRFKHFGATLRASRPLGPRGPAEGTFLRCNTDTERPTVGTAGRNLLRWTGRDRL